MKKFLYWNVTQSGFAITDVWEERITAIIMVKRIGKL
jgi:hypothetical protein